MQLFLKKKNLQFICVLLYDVQYCNVPICDFVWNVHGSAYLGKVGQDRTPIRQTY